MDEWYARDISRKLKTMYHTRATKGEPIGLPVYGYIKSQENPKYWEPDPKAALVVQRIYHLALTGYGVEQIARLLEKERVVTPTHYRLSQNSCGGRKGLNPYKWASSSIVQILRRQEYCGDVINLKTYSNSLRDNKRRPNCRDKMIVLKNVHESIIERSIWEHVQQKRQQNKRMRKAGKQLLFSGFLRCGDCGSNLHYHFNQLNPLIEYYNCSNYIGNRGTCLDTHYVRLDFLQEQILKEINSLLSIAHSNWDSFVLQVEQRKMAAIQESEQSLTVEYKALIKRREELAAIIAKLYEDKITGDIDDETYRLLSNTFKSERGDNRQKSQQLQEAIQRNLNVTHGIEQFLHTLARYHEIQMLTREVLHELVDFISIYPAIRNGKEYTQMIEINYLHIGAITEKSFCSQVECECSYRT